MKARIVVVNASENKKPPLVPTLVVQNEDTIALCGDGWARPLASATLEEVTAEDVRAALRLPADLPIHLSASRSLPSANLLSAKMLARTRRWWLAEASVLSKKLAVAAAS
jgi:hypothetical protein